MISSLLAWIQVHPWVTLAILVYLVANVAPRPDPDKLTGWTKAFWQIVDRLAFLTRDKVPGRLKLILLDSPSRPESAPVTETPDEVDTKAPEVVDAVVIDDNNKDKGKDDE